MKTYTKSSKHYDSLDNDMGLLDELRDLKGKMTELEDKER